MKAKNTKTTKPTDKPTTAGGTPSVAERDPRLPKPGTVISREYKGKTYKLTVLETGFKLSGPGIKKGDAEVPSLSKAAKVVRAAGGAEDHEVNGYQFFGLTTAPSTTGGQS